MVVAAENDDDDVDDNELGLNLFREFRVFMFVLCL